MISKVPSALLSYLRGNMRPLVESAFAIFVGLVVGGLILLVLHYNPIDGYVSMFKGFGIFIEQRNFGLTEFAYALAFATPYMLTALTFAVGMRAGLFNIGAEGQVYIGGAAAAWIAGHFALPVGFHVFAVTIIAMLAGALWALVPALLKIRRGVHEVISAIMLNWIAYYLVMYLAIYHLSGKYAHITAEALPTARYEVLGMVGRIDLIAMISVILAVCLGVYILLWRTRVSHIGFIQRWRMMLFGLIVGGSYVAFAYVNQHFGKLMGGNLTTVIYVAIALCVGVYVFLWRMYPGYEIRLVGDNPDAARYAGISISRAILLSFIIGGLAAGLAGASLAIRPTNWGFNSTLGDFVGYGFVGIGVALVGRNHPIGIIPSAIFFGGLENSGRYLEADLGVSSELVGGIQGIIIMAMALPLLVLLLARLRRKAK